MSFQTSIDFPTSFYYHLYICSEHAPHVTPYFVPPESDDGIGVASARPERPPASPPARRPNPALVPQTPMSPYIKLNPEHSLKQEQQSFLRSLALPSTPMKHSFIRSPSKPSSPKTPGTAKLRKQAQSLASPYDQRIRVRVNPTIEPIPSLPKPAISSFSSNTSQPFF